MVVSAFFSRIKWLNARKFAINYNSRVQMLANRNVVSLFSWKCLFRFDSKLFICVINWIKPLFDVSLNMVCGSSTWFMLRYQLNKMKPSSMSANGIHAMEHRRCSCLLWKFQYVYLAIFVVTVHFKWNLTKWMNSNNVILLKSVRLFFLCRFFSCVLFEMFKCQNCLDRHQL